jgi:threonine/homoserine/homoserine lactone efflux protein
MLFKGFRMGMLLQIAVGPICAYIFQTAAEAGFWAAETGVLGVALADALYIFAALLGLGALIDGKPALKRALKYGGAAVMLLFGVLMLLSTVFPDVLPGFKLTVKGAGVFVSAGLLTLSSPLTIVFWAGVFAQRAGEEGASRKGLALYGVGAVCSTLAFLSVVAALGGISRVFLPDIAIRIMNGAVALVLIGFGVYTAVKTERRKDKQAS